MRQSGGETLKGKRLSRVYASRLQAEYDALRAWSQRKRPLQNFRDFEELDQHLEAYVQAVYASARGQSSILPKLLEKAKHAILGVQHLHRHTQGHLKSTWESIFTWELEMPVSTRVPVPPEISAATGLWSLVLGFLRQPGRALHWITLGVGIRIMFGGLVRPGEFLKLR